MTQPFHSILQRLVMVEELRSLYATAQDEVEGAIGRSICMPNCGLCCEHNAVLVWGFEVESIISWLVGKEQGFQDNILDRCEEWLLDNNNLPLLSPQYLKDHPQKMIEMVHAINSTRCPLLASDKRCLIHEERPFPCRAFGVTTYPVGCPRPAGIGEHGTTRAYNRGLGLSVRAMLDKLLNEIIAKDDVFAATVGYLPTLLFAKLRADKFAALVSSSRINPIKLATNLVNSPALLYEQQRQDFELAGDKALDGVVKNQVKSGPVIVTVK